MFSQSCCFYNRESYTMEASLWKIPTNLIVTADTAMSIFMTITAMTTTAMTITAMTITAMTTTAAIMSMKPLDLPHM